MRTGDERDLLASQCRRVPKLVLQIGAVVDEADLVILEVVAHAQLADHEDHRQRLARSLRVPDDAGTVVGCFALAEPVDDLADGPVLLIASDHLGPLLADIHEDRAGANQIKQRFLGQHSLYESFLGTHYAQRRREGAILLGINVPPREEELLVGRRNRANVGLLAARADQQLIRDE